jgi:hypothetical protein
LTYKENKDFKRVRINGIWNTKYSGAAEFTPAF